MKNLYVKKSRINGNGLFANKNFAVNQTVDYIHGPTVLIRKFTPRVSKNGINWIGASKYTWINTDKSVFKFINHSCNPNAAIKGKRTVYAIKNIPAGEEITMDYSLTETEIDWSIENCACGSKNCRVKIGPITSLDAKTFQQKENLITDRFKKIYFSKKTK